MKFAIRDDDTCYFTHPEELDRVYTRFWPGIPVSLAVTPFAVESFHLGDPIRFRQNTEPHALAANPELCAYLRERVASGQASIMLHGYTHEYRRLPNGALIQEYVWKPAEQLARETAVGAQHLSTTLDRMPTAFVPPGNALSSAALQAVGQTISRVLATVPLRRPTATAAWVRRAYHQLRHGGPRPHAEQINGVWLHPSYTLSALSSYRSLCDRFRTCQSLGANFILAVHYWELHGKTLDNLYRLVDFALAHGAQPASCDGLFPPERPQ